jgi:FkbM family methyltransferase
MQQIDVSKFNGIKSYSQDKQDVFVLDYLKKRNGFFVDVGAGHYQVLSNTYLMEQEYDWNGICIEGNPKLYKKLKQNRRCICVNKYVSTIAKLTILNKVIPNNDDEEGYYSFIDVQTPVQQLIQKSCRGRITKILIRPVLLMDILDNNNAPLTIDYLSIDIEGLDFVILKTIDFNKYTFKIITIEEYIPNIYTISPQSILITDYLRQYDYKLIGRLSQDLVYVHQ